MRLDAKLHKPRGLNAEIKRLKSVNVSLGGVTVTSEGYTPPTYEGATIVTPTKASQTLETDGCFVKADIKVNPIPDEYVIPEGTKRIETNGEHDVKAFEKVDVDVDIPDGYVKLPQLSNEGTSADLVAGKELIDSNGNIVEGLIPTRSSSDISVSGATVTVPPGLYDEQATKSVATATQATPSISVSTAGKITAKATQSAGYVASGTKQATKQLTTQAAKTVTPTKSSQTAVASGRYTTGAVTVAPIPDEYIIPSGTKAITENGTHDVTEFTEVNVSVEGKEEVVLQSKTVTPTKSTQEVTADANYTALEKVTVNPIPNEYIIPQGSRELTVNYDLYDVRELEAVYVNVPEEIPEGYYDASGITTPTSDVRKGKEFINKDGRKVGTMTEYSNEEIDHILNVNGYPQNMDNIYYPIPNGYHYYSGYVSIDPESKTATPTKSAQNITPTDGKVLYKVTVNPIPDEYIIPSGELPITENGTYDVTEKASVTVNVEGGGGGGGESELPEGYKRCDYILFSGTQWVDTGIVGNQDTQINTCFTWENSTQRHLFGCASSDNTKSITSYMNGSWRFGAKSTSKSFGTKNSLLPYSVLVNKTTISTTNSATAISGVADFETVGTLLLGGARDADGTEPSVGIYARVYFFYMWQGEEQVRKLVPVTDGNGVYRFWDMITKTFFDSITSNPLGGGMI